MNPFECILCKHSSDSDLEFNSTQGCKLASGNPCISCLKATELDELISKAQQDLENLAARRRDLRREINKTHDPLHNLPPEVSATIFFFSLSDDAPDSLPELDVWWDRRKPNESCLTTPLILGGVCHLWRSIVWATLRLWTEISIPVKPQTDPHYLDFADEWLRRSGQLPLSLFIYTPPRYGSLPHEDPNLLACLSCLIGGYLSRCYYLGLRCPIGHLPSISGEAPILDEIYITSNDVESDIKPIELYSTKAEGVRVSAIGYCLRSLKLPFQNVSYLQGLWTLDECVSILAKCPNLELAEIVGFRENPASTSQGGPTTTHRHLKRLTLNTGYDPSAALLGAVNLPSLTFLRVWSVDIPMLHRFILRSNCNLRTLHIGPLVCQDKLLCDMLQSVNSLEELYFFQDNTNYSQAEALFVALAETSIITTNDSTQPTSTFLPNLSTFYIEFSNEKAFPWDLAAGIFGSLEDIRNPLRRPMKNLHVVTSEWSIGFCQPLEEERQVPATHFLNADVTRRFLDLTREGININLRDSACGKGNILPLAVAHYGLAMPE